MRLDILIPTYNRCSDLLKNLALLKQQIIASGLQSEIKVIVSDNCSADNTQQAVFEFIQDNSYELKIEYFRQAENVGLEKNVVSILSKSTSPYVMFLGDDDYLPEGYLSACYDKIAGNDDVGCVIPGLSSLLKNGTVIEGRKESFGEKILAPGYDSVWTYSHLGHQMSGVVCKRHRLLENYLKNPEYRNIYLFIFFVADRLAQYRSFYLPKFKVHISLFNVKDWSYNKIGLLDEVFKSYYPFIDTYGEDKVAELMIRFLIMHSYRLNVRSLTFFKVFRLYHAIIKSIKPVKGIKRLFFVALFKEYIAHRVKKSNILC